MSASALAAPMLFRDADRASKLAAIAASGACEQGGVVALDFTAVRSAMGGRWQARRNDVHCSIERKIDKHVPRGSVVLRMTECEYMISFAYDRGPAAQVMAFNIMEDLLTHFLGRCEPQDLVVRCVGGITGDEVHTSPLSRMEVEREKERSDAAQAAAPRPPPVLAATLVEVPDERLSLTLTPQEVVHLASGAHIGLRTPINLHRAGVERPLCSHEEQSVSAPSLLEANLHAIEAMRRMMETSCRPAVFILPLFLQTFTQSRGRTAILDELRRLRSCDQRRLVLELTGIERGTPSSRVMEAAWRLKPFCRAITGRAQLERAGLAGLSGARLSGIHVSVRDLGASRQQRAEGLLAAGQAARNLAPMVMATDLPDKAAFDLCRVAGFTHATIPRAGDTASG